MLKWSLDRLYNANTMQTAAILCCLGKNNTKIWHVFFMAEAVLFSLNINNGIYSCGSTDPEN